MELKSTSSRTYRPPRTVNASRPVNECAQCRETIFLPEWSEYLDARRVRQWRRKRLRPHARPKKRVQKSSSRTPFRRTIPAGALSPWHKAKELRPTSRLSEHK